MKCFFLNLFFLGRTVQVIVFVPDAMFFNARVLKDGWGIIYSSSLTKLTWSDDMLIFSILVAQFCHMVSISKSFLW
jgi:hypothetical protein